MIAKRKKGPTFVARNGNVKVPVYTVKLGCPNEHHVVCYYEDGQRQRRNYSDLEEAKAEATIIAEKLSKGDLEAIRLTGPDRLAYLAAQEHLRPTGISMVLASKEYAEIWRILNGVSPLEAVRFYVDHRQDQFAPQKVIDVVEELIAQKKSKGKSIVYLKDLGRLRRFASDKKFTDMFIHQVDGKMIEAWLASLKCEPRTLNNYLKLIGTLFRYAKKMKYLTKDHPGTSEVEAAEEDCREIEIFTPTEMATLIEAAKPCMVPYLAIGAFAGIRSAELERLDWSDVKFDRNVIEIKAMKAKTRSRRLAPITDNLRAWLQPHSHPKGPIAPFANMSKQLMWLSEAAGVPWKHNALRHSYISYRMAQIKNENQVALESGNSPRMIFSNYRELVAPEDAKRYFGIMPVTAANVIPMPQAAAAS